jgi:hypothetical protein
MAENIEEQGNETYAKYGKNQFGTHCVPDWKSGYRQRLGDIKNQELKNYKICRII